MFNAILSFALGLCRFALLGTTIRCGGRVLREQAAIRGTQRSATVILPRRRREGAPNASPAVENYHILRHLLYAYAR